MRIFSIVLFLGLLICGTSQAGTAFQLHFMAVCLDGDGPLTDWVNSKYDAYLVGSEHERATRGHRWEILTRESGGGPPSHTAVCGKFIEGSKPDTIRLENTCGKCVRFLVSRTTADGITRRREIKLDAKKGRSFRKLAGAVIRLEGERDCSG